MNNFSDMLPGKTLLKNQPVQEKLCSTCGLCMIREYPGRVWLYTLGSYPITKLGCLSDSSSLPIDT